MSHAAKSCLRDASTADSVPMHKVRDHADGALCTPGCERERRFLQAGPFEVVDVMIGNTNFRTATCV